MDGDELDIEESKTVNLSELSNVVDNDVIKRTQYNKLVTIRLPPLILVEKKRKLMTLTKKYLTLST